MKRRPLGLLLAIGLLAALPLTAAAQGSVDPHHGTIAVASDLRGLGSVKRVLVIGAHPDDEDTELLTWLERGVGADAAYLSLSRGEGGQNLIGPELGVGLGLIRTEELLAARRLDGAQQFFSRAYDFGYSKTAAETFRFWPRDSLLADVVSVIRRFRPQVVVSIFSGTPRDGHGQHQAAGIVAQEAFRVAGDSTRFPDQIAAGLRPWRPLKLYRSARFDTAATTLTLQTGDLDPLYGRSYHQIAMASRSEHRSQDMGRIQPLGPSRTRLDRLVAPAAAGPAASETSPFDGVDTTLAGLVASTAPAAVREHLEEGLAAYRSHLDRARAVLGPSDLAAMVPELAAALGELRRVRVAADSLQTGGEDLRFVLDEQLVRLDDAVSEAAGVIVDAFGDDGLVIPRESLDVEMQIWNGGGQPVDLRGVHLEAPPGWQVERLDATTTQVPPNTLARRRFRVRVPANAQVSQPYFLRQPRHGDLYSWPADPWLRGLPFAGPLLTAHADLSIDDQAVERSAEVVYRFGDPARGEVRRPIAVVPAVGVTLTPDVAAWPLDQQGERAFRVQLRGEAKSGADGRVRLRVPEGWAVVPQDTAFHLASPGSETTAEFRVRPPSDLRAGEYTLQAVAETGDGQKYAEGYQIIDYPHIRRRLLFHDARARVEAIDVKVASGLRAGYIPGAGDAVPEAARSLGVNLETLDASAVAGADLSKYDVIVTGIRAYETNPALVANNDRVLEYVRGGGTLIVQYQQYPFFRGHFAPYPMTVARPHDRVTDETAPVKVLAPDDPIFNQPNRIGPDDWKGWVQERGLYFAHTWDAQYRPLLEMSDPGESPKRGALLVAHLGKGLYVYSGLALFRQLPAGVPGAYRLLANLLSLGR